MAKFRLKKSGETKSDGGTAGTRPSLAGAVREARGGAAGGGVVPDHLQAQGEAPRSADAVSEAKTPAAVGKDREGGEETVEASTEVQIVQAPKETVSMTVEDRKHLPILTTGSVDLAKESKKAGKTPKFQCSTCSIGPDCPEYKEGYVCAYNDAFSAFPVRDTDSVMELMRRVIDRNKVRLMRAFMSEELVGGGALDMNVTRMSEVVLAQTRTLLELSQDQRKMTLSVSGEDMGRKGPGILAQLFGGASSGQATSGMVTINPPTEERPHWEPVVDEHPNPETEEATEPEQEVLDADGEPEVVDGV